MNLATWSGRRIAVLALAASFTACGCAHPHAADSQSAEDEAGFKEFSTRVQQYVELHKRAEKSLPALKTTDLPELITAHQEALARNFARRDPMLSLETCSGQASKAFERVIAREFEGSQAGNARATIQRGTPLKAVELQVNQSYPEGLPSTTFPPTLLARLPQLPDELAYRIVDKDLVILDVKANLVVDLLAKAIP